MDLSKIQTLITVVILTVITGLADSQGFVHAAKVWEKGHFISPEAIKSAVAIIIGLVSYWLLIKFMQQYGIFSAEIQILIWFVVTIIGVALFSGKIFQWTVLDQAIALITLFGIGALIIRTHS